MFNVWIVHMHWFNEIVECNYKELMVDAITRYNNYLQIYINHLCVINSFASLLVVIVVISSSCNLGPEIAKIRIKLVFMAKKTF